MNKIKLLPFIALFTVFTTSIFAQQAFDGQSLDDFISNASVKVEIEGDYTGSPYLIDAFKSGNIFYKDELVQSNVPIRYNAFKDLMEVKRTDGKVQALKAEEDIYVRIQNDTFIFKPYNEESRTGGYYLVKFEGNNVTVLQKFKKEFLEGMKSYNSITRDVLPQFKDDEALFLNFKNDIEEVQGSRNKKLKLFPEHNKELKQFVRDNSININKDYNVIKVARYYDTL